MIACHDVSPAPCASERTSSHADETGAGLSSEEIACPRTVEILTVLNEVFDAFDPLSDAGVLKSVVPA
jgi:hypothetical protein